MSKVDLEHPETRRQHFSFDVPGWIRATYPVDLTPYELPEPIEYSFPLDQDTLATARRTRKRLERQGAKLNHIAERIFMEVPPVHRGARTAVRKDVSVDSVPSDGLEQRVSWGG